MKLTLPIPSEIDSTDYPAISEILKKVPSIKTIQYKKIGIYQSYDPPYEYIYHSKNPLMSSNRNLIDWKDWNELPELFSFSTGPACKKARIKDFYYEAESPILPRDELKAEIKRKLDIIKENFPNKIAIENTNYYPYPAYDWVTDADFISEIVYENDVYFCLDIAHALVTCQNNRYCLFAYLKKLPLDRIIEIHISKPGQVGNLARDLHEAPDKMEFWILDSILKRVKEDVYVAVEYDKCQETLIEVYQELEKRSL